MFGITCTWTFFFNKKDICVVKGAGTCNSILKNSYVFFLHNYTTAINLVLYICMAWLFSMSSSSEDTRLFCDN